MKKVNFPLFADTAFYAVCAFALSFCILRYYRVPLAVSIPAAICFLLATGLISYLLLSTKHRKKMLGKREQEEREKLLLHLALEKPERVRAALFTAYQADKKSVFCKEDSLCVDGSLHIPLFTMEPVSADGIAHLLRQYGSEFILLCNSLTSEAENLLASFSVPAVRGDDIYALFKRTQTMPEHLICGNIPRHTAKQKLHVTFSKKNARSFFISGILLLFMSLFVLFPVYYIISGSILLICAITIRFFGYASQ